MEKSFGNLKGITTSGDSMEKVIGNFQIIRNTEQEPNLTMTQYLMNKMTTLDEVGSKLNTTIQNQENIYADLVKRVGALEDQVRALNAGLGNMTNDKVSDEKVDLSDAAVKDDFTQATADDAEALNAIFNPGGTGTITPTDYYVNGDGVYITAAQYNEASEVIDISPGNLDSSLCLFQFSVSHDVLCI